MAFKGNSDDPRDSLSYKLRKVLLTMECRRVLCTDPYSRGPGGSSPWKPRCAEADVFFLGACHDEYQNLQHRQAGDRRFRLLREYRG